jgi:hypothetical protein
LISCVVPLVTAGKAQHLAQLAGATETCVFKVCIQHLDKHLLCVFDVRNRENRRRNCEQCVATAFLITAPRETPVPHAHSVCTYRARGFLVHLRRIYLLCFCTALCALSCMLSNALCILCRSQCGIPERAKRVFNVGCSATLRRYERSSRILTGLSNSTAPPCSCRLQHSATMRVHDGVLLESR